MQDTHDHSEVNQSYARLVLQPYFQKIQSNQKPPICLKRWQDNKQFLSFFLSFLSVSYFVTKEPSPLAFLMMSADCGLV